MVLDGAIRDVAEIGERTFPVYARGHTHRGPYKDGPGAINVPVSLGGMTFIPGTSSSATRMALSPSHQEAPTVIEKALGSAMPRKQPCGPLWRAAGTVPSSMRSKQDAKTEY